MGFPCGSTGKEFACNVGDLGSIPGLGRSPGEGKGYLVHYSGLKNSMNCIVHGVAKSQTRLSNFHFHIYIYTHTYICIGRSILIDLYRYLDIHRYINIYIHCILETQSSCKIICMWKERKNRDSD